MDIFFATTDSKYALLGSSVLGGRVWTLGTWLPTHKLFWICCGYCHNLLYTVDFGSGTTRRNQTRIVEQRCVCTIGLRRRGINERGEGGQLAKRNTGTRQETWLSESRQCLQTANHAGFGERHERASSQLDTHSTGGSYRFEKRPTGKATNIWIPTSRIA